MVGGQNLLFTCLIIGSTARVLARGPCAITAAKALLAVRGFSMPDQIGATTVTAAYSLCNHALSLPEQPNLCHYRIGYGTVREACHEFVRAGGCRTLALVHGKGV